MDKNGVLTIKDFQAGVADSPLLGFAKMNNVEIFEKQGVVKMQFGAAKSFNTKSLPVAMVYDTLGNQYVGCQYGGIYKNGTLLNTTPGICDMKIVSDGQTDPSGNPIEYLLYTTVQDGFGFYGPTYSTGAELAGGQAGLQTGSNKPIVIGIDSDNSNKPMIYVGNGNTIGAITNFVHIAVGTAPTYHWNPIALTLQPGHWAYSMNELGKYLAVGTVAANSLWTGSISQKKSAVILWDRTSPSFNLPVFFKENGVTSMFQMQNRLYVAIGNRGRIFITDGTNFEQAKRIPYCFNRQFGNYAYVYPNAMTLHNGEIVTGLSGNGVDATYGVYTTQIQPVAVGNSQINYPTIMRNSPSSGGTGATQQLSIGFCYSTGADQLYFGWQDGSTYGVDLVDFRLCSGFTSVIYSPYYTVGSELVKKTFKRMEISLTAPLLAGQQIRISYREDLNETSWTTLGTYDNTNFGSNNVFNTLANLASKVKLQFKIEMTQPTTSPFGTNIELESLSFYGSEK